MITQHTVKCDTDGCPATLTTEPPMKPTPSNLRLAETLRSIKGAFLLSINDHPDIRRLYKGLTKRKVNVQYSIARDKSPAARNRTELIIANYPLPRRR